MEIINHFVTPCPFTSIQVTSLRSYTAHTSKINFNVRVNAVEESMGEKHVCNPARRVTRQQLATTKTVFQYFFLLLTFYQFRHCGYLEAASSFCNYELEIFIFPRFPFVTFPIAQFWESAKKVVWLSEISGKENQGQGVNSAASICNLLSRN